MLSNIYSNYLYQFLFRISSVKSSEKVQPVFEVQYSRTATTQIPRNHGSFVNLFCRTGELLPLTVSLFMGDTKANPTNLCHIFIKFYGKGSDSLPTKSTWYLALSPFNFSVIKCHCLTFQPRLVRLSL